MKREAGTEMVLMMLMRRLIVRGLLLLCDCTHWLTRHRPFLWLPVKMCALASLSDRLDQRWRTGVWRRR
jgi:hypothetical protein